MNRITRALDNKNFYVVDDTKVHHDINGYSGDAINKLAKFENFYDDLISKQDEISKELEKIRIDVFGKMKVSQKVSKKLAPQMA